MATFRFVARLLAMSPKFVTVHSRGAEQAVLDTLTEFVVGPVVFHWYTGPVGLLAEIARTGHFFSVNPSMTVSANGRRIIEALPQDRVLTESDGPFGKVSGTPCSPWEVTMVESFLGKLWSKTVDQVRAIVWQNFRRSLSPVIDVDR